MFKVSWVNSFDPSSSLSNFGFSNPLPNVNSYNFFVLSFKSVETTVAVGELDDIDIFASRLGLFDVTAILN